LLEESQLKTLILIRHGKTVLNSFDSEERLRGWMDVPLDEQGIAEAHATAQSLRKHRVSLIYCSDLSRARQTAQAVAQATGAPIVYTPELRPWNVGSLAGQRVKDILPQLQELESNPALPAPDGESFIQFYERYERRLQELLLVASSTREHIVAITHVRNLLATPTILQGGDKTRIPVHGGPKTSALVWVEKNGSGWTLRESQEASSVATSPIITADLAPSLA
jgi:broad specificity phosphatase PhoE